jgi:NADH dehydrogenase FAD-containing subunit
MTTHAAPLGATRASTSSGLDALESRLREDLAWLELPAPAWVPASHADGERVLDVAIIGGGMAGLTASAELRLLGIDHRKVTKVHGSPMRAWRRCAHPSSSLAQPCVCPR